jgi:hypothetical protein
MTIEDIARICHEANESLCVTQQDFSQPSWDEAPDWQKSSAINGVKFHLDNPNATPENSHESWLAQKQAEGWKYGPVKNPETKEHPCFVPYAELPANQQAKDYLFRGIVHALAPFVAEAASA